MRDLLIPATIGLLLLVGAFAAMAETAITRVSRVKALHLQQEKRAGADRLLQIVEDPAPFMNMVLLLLAAAHVSAAVLATTWAARHLGAEAALVAAVVVTALVFVLAQMVPKTYTVQRLDRVALLMAQPVFFLGKGLQPLTKALVVLSNGMMALLPGRSLPKGPFATEDEIRHLVDVAEEEEEIEEEERELIHSIFEFGDTVVREVMVPRPDMVAVRSDATLEEALSTIVEAGYSRLPVYEGDTDNIVGILYAKDLLATTRSAPGAEKVSSLGRAPTFVPEQKKVAELLREMQQQRVHIAIVVDEYGGTAGLVTIEDLLEEIVGEIVDEYDQEEVMVETNVDGTVRVDGRVSIDEVNELLSAELPHDEWDTVGGLVFGLTGRVPDPGEVVRYDSLEFTTEKVSGRRIQKVLIRRSPADDAPSPPGS
ncbi:MAG: hemolysin family protein [Actinomycetota bacterium]